MELLTIRRGTNLVPAHPSDLEDIDRLQEGRALLTRITFDRSSQLQKWYWKFITVVARALDLEVKRFHIVLKSQCGLIDGIIAGPDGTQLIVQSTKFTRMGDDKFRPYVEQAKLVIFRDYLPGVDPKNVYRVVAEELAEDKRRGL